MTCDTAKQFNIQLITDGSNESEVRRGSLCTGGALAQPASISAGGDSTARAMGLRVQG